METKEKKKLIKEEKLESFDILRGFSAVMIFLCHAMQPFGEAYLKYSHFF